MFKCVKWLRPVGSSRERIACQLSKRGLQDFMDVDLSFDSLMEENWSHNLLLLHNAPYSNSKMSVGMKWGDLGRALIIGPLNFELTSFYCNKFSKFGDVSDAPRSGHPRVQTEDIVGYFIP
jgi:hypothetical protein